MAINIHKARLVFSIGMLIFCLLSSSVLLSISLFTSDEGNRTQPIPQVVTHALYFLMIIVIIIFLIVMIRDYYKDFIVKPKVAE